VTTYPPLTELVPHGPPMLLLDRVLSYSTNCLRCAVEIRPDSLFAGPDGVPAVVGVEYMAQAVAVYAGLKNRGEGKAVRIGFLLGSRDIRIDVDRFAIGDHLEVEARHTFGDADVGAFACRVERGGDVLLHGNLTVYQGPLPELPR
jgi:predicted hotdog family 3-hydroxylacyl-ACP dehydratase